MVKPIKQIKFTIAFSQIYIHNKDEFLLSFISSFGLKTSSYFWNIFIEVDM